MRSDDLCQVIRSGGRLVVPCLLTSPELVIGHVNCSEVTKHEAQCDAAIINIGVAFKNPGFKCFGSVIHFHNGYSNFSKRSCDSQPQGPVLILKVMY